jgi:serine/threonine protein kinase
MDQQTMFEFKQGIDNLINALHQNPNQFASNLYLEETTGPFWNRQSQITSPYLKTNNDTLCCLAGISSSPVKPKLCEISKVTPLTHQGKESDTYLVESGRRSQPQRYILKVYNLDHFEVFFSDAPRIPPIWSTQCFYPDVTNLSYLGTDTFTNEFLIGFILQDLYFQPPSNFSRLDGVITFLNATVCNTDKKKGVIFMEYANLGDIIDLVQDPLNSEFRNTQDFRDQVGNPIQLKSLKSSVIVDIFKQIVANLDFLHSELEFNHGDLKANNILVQSKTSQGNYQGLTWNSNFTVKLADFAKSSLTIVDDNMKKVRLFNHSKYADTYLRLFPFTPSLGNQFNEPYYIIDATTNLSALTHIRHAGVPIYFSWDSYTINISLLLIPEVFYPVMSDNRLRSVLFDNLWFPDEYSEIWNRLHTAVQQRKSNSYNIILDILRGLKLKCRANSILLEGLKAF